MNSITFALQGLLAIVLGALIGMERVAAGKPAGARTHALVCFGSMLFTLLSIYAFPTGESSRVAAQIVTGIGFLGAGTILHKKNTIEGLTTAAGLWAAAAIGMAIGAGWYIHALIGTILTFVILVLDEDKFIKRK